MKIIEIKGPFRLTGKPLIIGSLRITGSWTNLIINMQNHYWWLNRNNSWKCSCGSRITWYILCCCSFSFCSFFRSCNCYLLWSDLQWRKDCCLKEFITFILFLELSLSFSFNIYWYSSNLLANAFLRSSWIPEAQFLYKYYLMGDLALSLTALRF